MKFSLEKVTPAKAKEFLERNTNNRPLTLSRVEFLCTVIRNGEWEDNGDTIKFHKDGTLLDGQHRLHAIVRTGRSFDMGIARGLNGEAYNTLDQNKPRTLQDMLARDGEKSYSHLATTIRYAYIFSHSAPINALKHKLSIKEGYAVLAKSKNIRTTLATAMSWHAEKLGSVGILAGAYQACRTVGPASEAEWADEFWEGVFTGVGLGEHDQSYKLRQKLLDNKMADPHLRMDRTNMLLLIIKAWNCYATGIFMESCRITKADTKAKLVRVAI